jgi:hypothetical protein
MAKTLIDGGFACSICGARYASVQHADACRDTHDLLYIPISKAELNLLLNAIYTDNAKLVPMHLILTLQKYARQAVLNGPSGEVSGV